MLKWSTLNLPKIEKVNNEPTKYLVVYLENKLIQAHKMN